MGNCFSQSPRHAEFKPGNLHPSPRGMSNKTRTCKVASDFGLQVCLQTTQFYSSLHPQTFVVSRDVGKGALLVGMFEGQTMKAEATVGEGWAFPAALHCAHTLESAFNKACERFPGQPESKILSATIQLLHESCLQRKRPSTTPSSAVSCVLLLINLETRKCTIANLGHVQCLATGILGSFNAKRPWLKWLSTCHTTASTVETIKAARAEVSASPTHFSLPMYYNHGHKHSVHYITRALGIHNGEVRPTIQSIMLEPSIEHLIIGSSGIWNILSPPAAALRCHYYAQFEKARRFLEASAEKNGQDNIPTPAVLGKQTLSEHLIRLCLSTVAENHGMKGVKLSEADLEALPFERLTDQLGSIDCENGPLPVRGDFFDDLSCVTLSLSWESGVDKACSDPHIKTYESEQAYVKALAKHHWMLIRMLVNYHRMYHRHMVQRWFETIDSILQKARIRAKEVAERVRLEQGFDVDVSPLMKIKAKDGTPLPASAFAVGATTDF